MSWKFGLNWAVGFLSIVGSNDDRRIERRSFCHFIDPEYLEFWFSSHELLHNHRDLTNNIYEVGMIQRSEYIEPEQHLIGINLYNGQMIIKLEYEHTEGLGTTNETFWNGNGPPHALGRLDVLRKFSTMKISQITQQYIYLRVHCKKGSQFWF